MTVAGVILAAGNSSRMGRQKQALVYQGSTLLRRAAHAALDAGCEWVYVVLGSGADGLATELVGLPVRAVRNHQWQGGMGTSIRAGVQAAVSSEPSPDSVLLMLADQPLVGSNALRQLICAGSQGSHQIVAAEYAGSLGVPAIFTRSMFGALLSLADSEGAKKVILDAHSRVLGIPLPEAELDIDTPEDYRRVLTGAG